MNLHETAMGQRFFNVQLPALINTLKDIAAALSRPAPSAISFPADPRFLTSLYYGEYEADVFKLDKRLTPFNQAVQQKEKALLPLLSPCKVQSIFLKLPLLYESVPSKM